MDCQHHYWNYLISNNKALTLSPLRKRQPWQFVCSAYLFFPLLASFWFAS
jgi:hypothetical protein